MNCLRRICAAATFASAALLLLAISFVHGADEKCKGELGRCLSASSLSGPTGLPTNREEVDNLCGAYKRGMECVDAWNKECLPPESRAIAERQMASVRFFMGLLCNDTAFKREYLNHTECFAGVSDDWRRCHVKYSETVKEIDRGPQLRTAERIIDLCCARYGFNRCISLASRAKCDRASAVMLRRISETLSHTATCEGFQTQMCSGAASSRRPRERGAPLAWALAAPLLMLPMRR